METRRLKILRIVFIVFISGIACLLIGFIGMRFWIKSDINKYCNNATILYPGDKVEALIAVVKSESSTLEEKNHAIWTLEYVGDYRALSTLKEMQTGKSCDHQQYVCQRELLRAIGNIEGSNTVLMKFK